MDFEDQPGASTVKALTASATVGSEDCDDGKTGRLAQIRSLLSAHNELDPEDKVLLATVWTQDTVVVFICDMLLEDDCREVGLVFDVLSLISHMDIKTLRSICLIQREKGSLLECCVRALKSRGDDEGIILHISELFRVLLEPGLGADTFISDVYETGFLETISTPLTTESGPPFLQQCVLDILSFCICSHPGIAKGYFLRCGSLFKSLRSILLKEATPPFKVVTLAAIRLIRAFLWQKDIHLFKCLHAFNIPSLVIQLVYLHRPNEFVEGTMIYSAALEVMTFLCVNQQTNAIEVLCRPGCESEELIRSLADDTDNKSHCELARFMLSTADRMCSQYMCSGGEDLTSRHSIGSSRGRSASPHPLVVPMAATRKRLWGEDDIPDGDEELIPRTPGASPDLTPEVKRTRSFSIDDED